MKTNRTFNFLMPETRKNLRRNGHKYVVQVAHTKASNRRNAELKVQANAMFTIEERAHD